METLLGVLMGIGLAAACGFRVFLPLLVLSIAAKTGHVPLAPDFAWVAGVPALVALATATVLEILAYYVPWLDHILDAIATPAAIFAGVLATAAVIPDLAPVLRWTLAVVGGGGIAGAVQGATVLTRLKSTATTAGLANPVVASAEVAGATVTSVLAIVVPVLAVVAIIAMLVIVFAITRRILFGRRGARPRRA